MIMRARARRTRMFGVGVDGAGGFVEDEDAGVVGEGAGEADELLLSGGEGGAAFAHGLGKLQRQGADEVADVDFVGGALEAFVGDPRGAEADVVGDGAGEEEGVLQDDAEALAQRVEVLLADVDAVDEDAAALDVVEAHHQAGDGGLAGAGVADDGGGLVGLDDEGDAAEDPFDVGDRCGGLRRWRWRCGRAVPRRVLVGEPDVAELDAAGAVACDGMRGRDDGRFGVEQLEDALAGGHGGLQDVVFVAEVLDGPEEALRVLDEGDEDAERDGAEDASGAGPVPVKRCCAGRRRRRAR